jgi:hypothetical protein
LSPVVVMKATAISTAVARGSVPQGKVESWTCKKSAILGAVYVFYFGKPISELAGLGVCDSAEIEECENDGWDWTDAPVGWFCKYRPLVAFENPVTVEDILADSVLRAWWRGRPFQGGPKEVTPPEACERLIEVILKKNRADLKLARILVKLRLLSKANGARSGKTKPRQSRRRQRPRA